MRMGLQGGGRGAQRLEHRNRSSRSWQRVRTQGSWWHIWVPAWRGRHPLCSYGPSPALTLFHQGSDVGYLGLMFYGLYVPFVLWSHCNNLFTFVNIYFFKDFRGKEKEKERENVWLPLVHPVLGTWPATQACALTGNQTSDPLVHSPRSVHWATPARAVYLCEYLIDSWYASLSLELHTDIRKKRFFFHS